MTKKLYNIFLNDKKIGTTELEKADATMGVVFGKIHFIDIPSGYEFFKTHCLRNGIKINYDHPEDRAIATICIPNLKVVDQNGIEISGVGTNVEGMDDDVFEVIILGVSYPFFEEEFPHHVI